MKRHRLLVVVVIGVTGVLGLLVLGYRSFGHYALRTYLTELRSKGEKVTVPELAASLTPGVTDSSIVLSNLVLKLGPAPANPTNLDLMHFVALGRAWVASKRPVPPWASSSGDMATNWTTLSNRVMQMAAPLAELRLAMKQPAPNVGPLTNLFQIGAHYTVIRTAGCWLACAGLSDLRDGRRGEALANLQALAGLANLYKEQYTLSYAMMRVAIARVGLDLTWEALQTSEWHNEQLLELQKSWESVDLLDGLERGFEGERIFGVESFNRLRSEKECTSAPSPSSAKELASALCEGFVKHVWTETVIANDFRFGISHWQGKIELVRNLRANRPLKEVLVPWQNLDNQLYRKNRLPLRFFYIVSLLSIPNSKPALLQTLRVETERRLAVTAVALNRYKHQHGRPPARLEALVPDFMSRLPLDCMSGHQFGYQCNPDGTFNLYSVGEDGIDNGGDPSPVGPGGKLGLWEGRDAVWPLPAL